MSQPRADARYTPREELANSLTHAVGVLLSVTGTVLLLRAAEGALAVASSLIFGLTLVALYTASTLYHATPNPRVKRSLRVLDHAAIYLLIAGTYTPLSLVAVRGGWGLGLMLAAWCLAAVGVVTAVVSLRRFRALSMVLYLAMGWMVVVVARQVVAALDPVSLGLLLGGGIAYTGGLAFYAWRRLPFAHAVWHGFVLAGSVLHFVVVLRVVSGPSV